MPYNLQSLLTTYVRMRQQGQAMAIVVNQLQSAVQQLPWADRVRLNELITDWEGKYGSLIGQPGSPVSRSQHPATPLIICYRCNHSNPTNSTVCQTCGQPLQATIAPDLSNSESSLIQSLFTLYIRMRRQGQTMDNVVNNMQDSAQQLNREDRHQLGELVTDWEDKIGRYLQAPMVLPAVQPTQQPPLPPRPANHHAFGTRMLDPSKIEGLVGQSPPIVGPQPILCLICNQLTPVGSLICKACGQPLQAKPVQPTRKLEDAAPKKSTQLADFFSQGTALLIAIRGHKSVLEAFPRERLVIGRGASMIKGQPFLDLTPYDGEALGVSRTHAEIRYVTNTLVVTDLESDNGTYINNVRLYPHEIRVLHNNDVMRVGKLEMKLSFR